MWPTTHATLEGQGHDQIHLWLYISKTVQFKISGQWITVRYHVRVKWRQVTLKLNVALHYVHSWLNCLLEEKCNSFILDRLQVHYLELLSVGLCDRDVQNIVYISASLAILPSSMLGLLLQYRIMCIAFCCWILKPANDSVFMQLMLFLFFSMRFVFS